MIVRALAIIFYVSSVLVPLYGQDTSSFKVMFWNVENLFDCQSDTLKNDNEFLPSSLRNWHYGRYKKKLDDVSKAITAVGGWEPPALVGLCEVENDAVLQDLTKYSSLKEHGYRYVMTDSPDERGIDVALLYQRNRFKLLGHGAIPVDLGGKRLTRDILHVSGLIATMDTLDVFVVHFPSRSGGEKETEPHRMKAARILRNAVDSLFRIRSKAGIIIMGDFNDYPNNQSIASALDAQPPGLPVNNKKLYHLLARKAGKPGYGSYKYQGKWGLLDHIIVSGALLHPSEKFHTDEERTEVIHLPFLFVPDEKYGGKRPFRTYYGMKYEGGFSDHLPVCTDFLLINN